MSACARKHCGRNVFLPAVSSHGHPVVAENKVWETPPWHTEAATLRSMEWGQHKQTKIGPFLLWEIRPKSVGKSKQYHDLELHGSAWKGMISHEIACFRMMGKPARIKKHH